MLGWSGAFESPRTCRSAFQNKDGFLRFTAKKNVIYIYIYIYFILDIIEWRWCVAKDLSKVTWNTKCTLKTSLFAHIDCVLWLSIIIQYKISRLFIYFVSYNFATLPATELNFFLSFFFKYFFKAMTDMCVNCIIWFNKKGKCLKR